MAAATGGKRQVRAIAAELARDLPTHPVRRVTAALARLRDPAYDGPRKSQRGVSRMERIALVGGGLIGQAWAIVFGRAGHPVMLYDADAAMLEQARRNIA